jgi:hypothetical protein
MGLARGARVVISGAVSQYNATEAPRGPANYMQLLVQRASMTGFLIFDYMDRFPEGVTQLAEWLRIGELQSREDVVQGDIDQSPTLYSGSSRAGTPGSSCSQSER